MRRIHRPILVLVLSLVWLPFPEASGQVSRDVVPSSVGVAAVPGPVAVVAPDPFDLDPNDFKAQHVTINMEVGDPIKSLASVERLVRKMGGEVTSSSGSPSSANLNARVAVRRTQQVSDAIRAIPGRVTNTNQSSSDYSRNAQQAMDRLERLVRADGELVRAFKTAPNADAMDGLMMLRELADRERQNVKSEIRSLREDSIRSHLSVRLSRISK